MQYYFLDVEAVEGNVQRHIFTTDGVNITSFPLKPDNPNTPIYEAWVAEGNEPQPWNPDTP